MSINNGRSIPGPNPSFLGLKEFIIYAKGSITGLLEKYGHYGPVIRVYVGPFVWILLSDLQSYQTLFMKTKSFHRGKMHQAAGLIAPNALFTTEGTEWRRQRLAMNPYFAEEEMERYCSDILNIAKEEIDELENDKPFLMKDFIRVITARVLMKCLFNVSVNKKNAEELKRFNDAIGVIGDQWVGIYLIIGLLCPILTKTTFMKNLMNKKTVPFKTVIKEMKENPSPDCLWQQLTQNDKFTWEEFENQSVGLMIAGFDTTTYSICWVFHSLTKYPEIKSKLKQEIDSVLGGKTPTSADLKHLPYLEKVILETLRFQPIATYASRTAIEQDSIGDYNIPKDITLFTTSDSVKNAVDNPHIFDPDRINEENMKQFSKIAMSSFGWGPHQCVGKYLAMLEMKLIIVTLLQKGDIKVDLTTDEINPHFPVRNPKKLTAIKKS